MLVEVNSLRKGRFCASCLLKKKKYSYTHDTHTTQRPLTNMVSWNKYNMLLEIIQAHDFVTTFLYSFLKLRTCALRFLHYYIYRKCYLTKTNRPFLFSFLMPTDLQIVMLLTLSKTGPQFASFLLFFDFWNPFIFPNPICLLYKTGNRQFMGQSKAVAIVSLKLD